MTTKTDVRIKTVKVDKAVIIPTLAEADRETRSFIPNLLFIRTKMDLSKPEMARQLGIDEVTYWRWENGMREPDNYNFMVVNLWAKVLKDRSAY